MRGAIRGDVGAICAPAGHNFLPVACRLVRPPRIMDAMPRTTHGLYQMRRALTKLTTRRLDGRSAVAVAARRWKADVTADLGGSLSRAQETILEAAAQKLIIRDSLSDFLMRLPSLVTRKRQAVPVLQSYLQVSDSLNRDLERLGIERRVKDVPSLDAFLAEKDAEGT